MKQEATLTEINKAKFTSGKVFKYKGTAYMASHPIRTCKDLGHISHVHTYMTNPNVILFTAHEANIKKIATLCVYVYKFVMGTQVKIKLRFADMDFESCEDVKEREMGEEVEG
jgi:hypothetical protein